MDLLWLKNRSNSCQCQLPQSTIFFVVWVVGEILVDVAESQLINSPSPTRACVCACACSCGCATTAVAAAAISVAALVLMLQLIAAKTAA